MASLSEGRGGEVEASPSMIPVLAVDVISGVLCITVEADGEVDDAWLGLGRVVGSSSGRGVVNSSGKGLTAVLSSARAVAMSSSHLLPDRPAT